MDPNLAPSLSAKARLWVAADRDLGRWTAKTWIGKVHRLAFLQSSFFYTRLLHIPSNDTLRGSEGKERETEKRTTASIQAIKHIYRYDGQDTQTALEGPAGRRAIRRPCRNHATAAGERFPGCVRNRDEWKRNALTRIRQVEKGIIHMMNDGITDQGRHRPRSLWLP
jgi:hypothetical protein